MPGYFSTRFLDPLKKLFERLTGGQKARQEHESQPAGTPLKPKLETPFVDYSSILKQREHEYAQQAVERFVRRFEPSYRKLVYYAALPLVLTPELVNYLRNQFLREENVPWVAEVDLLVSELCREVGYELYAMDTAVRAYTLSTMRQEVGVERMQNVARLLINYVQQLSRTNPYIGKHELQAQQWAAMAYLDDKREVVVQEIAESFRNSFVSAEAATPGAGAMVDYTEMLRLSRLVQTLSPELEQYPELIEYARDVTHVLTHPEHIPLESLRREREVAGVKLTLEPLLQEPQPQPEQREWTEPVTGMEFVWVPPGRYMMGQTEVDKKYLIQEIGKEKYKEYYYDSELPRHEVHIKNGFWMGKYPVTQGQWLEVMGKNPSYFGEKRVGKEWRGHPVENVSWDDVQEFLRKLNAKVGNTPQPPSRGEYPPQPLPGGDTSQPPSRGEYPPQPLPGGDTPLAPLKGGYEFRLPSEAEWEYACRAGAETMFCFGDEIEELKEYAWYNKNSGSQTHPVGQLKPNTWGLYDMHGNVWEWCADSWHDSYKGAPSDEQVWEEESSINLRLLRGGAWHNHPGSLRCACRNWGSRYLRDYSRGFRLVRSGGVQ